jgi:N-acetylneuraminate synthase/N,N'-diacetyllegionaminate synthase
MSFIIAGTKKIGEGQPCFLAAEVGINHNGDLDLAHRCIEAAADAGADAVKFQNYRTEQFVHDRSLTYEYESQGKKVVESQYDMFKRCELAPKSLRELSDHCRRREVVFFTTPMDEQGVADAVQAGAPIMKNGSDCLGHLPLIRAMARTKLPTIISTGMAVLGDIDDAVREFRGAGGEQLILLHCVSLYPTPPEDLHLRKIPAMSAAFGCPVGLSDHSEGVVAAAAAVALGACMIEKHFTLDRNLPGPDHRFSSDPAEFKALRDHVRTLEKALGKSALVPLASEESMRKLCRLSCAAAAPLKAGRRLEMKDIAYQRPASGFPPRMAELLVGRKLGRDVPLGRLFTEADFE